LSTFGADLHAQRSAIDASRTAHGNRRESSMRKGSLGGIFQL
jgi:hypothetical protein